MSTPRKKHCLIVSNGKLFAIGGGDYKRCLQPVETFDPADTSGQGWAYYPPMMYPRYNASAIGFDDKVYVPGGYNDGNVITGTVQTLSIHHDFVFPEAPAPPGPPACFGSAYQMGEWANQAAAALATVGPKIVTVEAKAEADYIWALDLAKRVRDVELARLGSLKQFVAEATEQIKGARGAAKRGRGPSRASPRRTRQRPNAHYCPITHGVMGAPVFAQDGNTYERAAIEEWFRT